MASPSIQSPEALSSDLLLEALSRPHTEAPLSLLRTASRRWHHLCPRLLALAEEEIRQTEIGSRREYSDLTLFTLYLAAEHKASEAFPLLIRLLSYPDTYAERRIGEILSDDLPIILADCFPGTSNLEDFTELLVSSNLPVVVRKTVLLAIEILASQQRVGQPELKTFLETLADRGLEPHQPQLWTAYADVCLAGGIVTMEPIVLEAQRRGWLGSGPPSAPQIRAVFEQVRQGHYQPFPEPLTIESAADEVEQWHWEQARALALAHSGRTGRNERCPCGSGKKFKRCCWGLTSSLPA
ncbi:MAG: DUF1186 domain-containing protein [Verrucomicrobiota bacterium]